MEGAPYPKFVLRNIWTAPNMYVYNPEINIDWLIEVGDNLVAAWQYQFANQTSTCFE